MANPHRGELSFEVDELTYTMAFSTNSICELEEKLGRAFMSIAKELEQYIQQPETIRISTLRAIFWSGLRKHHPHLTLEDAGDLMTGSGGALKAMELISEGFARAFPTPESKGARPPKAGQNGDGTGMPSSSPGLVSASPAMNSGA